MTPIKRGRHTEDDADELLAVESARFGQDTRRKRQRVYSNGNSSTSRNAPTRSPSASHEPEGKVLSDADDAALPASTQYEIMRDGNFEHLQDPDEDDKIATQRFLARNQLIGDNHAADNAIIEEITCINFMCHSKLHVELSPLINFVVGENGSGKSAVLTAVTLCLGGKASSTNRGASMKSLIKTGCDNAILIIKLKNEGNDAYQPDVYGKSIIIERHFSRTGSSGYKLKSSQGRTISSKKGDVDDVVEYYQLQVDNPMNVLTQDAAKSFISQSTPAQKYKFFVEGVQLEALDRDYKLISDTIDQVESKMAESKDDLKDLKKAQDAAKAKFDAAKQQDGLRDRARQISYKLAWSQVADEEIVLEEREKKVIEAEQAVVNGQENADKTAFMLQVDDQALERANEYKARVEEELGPLRAEEEVAKEAHTSASQDTARAHKQQKEIKTSLDNAANKVLAFQRDIRQEKQRMEDANGGAHTRKTAQIEAAEKDAMEAQETLQQAEQELPQLLENRDAAQEELKRRRSKLGLKERDIRGAQDRLSALRRDRGNVMAGYDRNMLTALKMITEDRTFREKPVGPIGLHLTLKRPEWGQVLESVMGAMLNGFIVTNKPDQIRLSGILRSLKMEYCPIVIGNNQALNTVGHEPDPQFQTILRALDIDNELVKRQLIISQGIEQSILVEQRAEALQIMYEGPRPVNVRQCFCFHDQKRNLGFGHRLAFVGRTSNRDMSPVYPPRNPKPRMRSDAESQIGYLQEALHSLEEEMKTLAAEVRQATTMLQRRETAIIQHKRHMGELKIALQRAEQHVEQLSVELDQCRVEDGRLDGLQENLRSAEEEVKMYEEAYGNKGLDKEKLNRVAIETKRELDAVKERLKDLDFKLEKAANKIRKLEQNRRHTLSSKNLAFSQVDVYKAVREKAIAKRDQQAKQVEEFARQAGEVCAERVDRGPGETTQGLNQTFERLREQIKAYNKKLGGELPEIEQAYADAQAVFRNAKGTRQEMEELVGLLKQSFQERLTMYRRFQRLISARSRINFLYLLSERAFRGELKIDHKTKLLDVRVEPDETQHSGGGRQTKALSGGEKSFSSICLLLALWEAMGAPLRCLDEYDVFMDDVNRDVSTKMIISAARRSVSRQFILITPKGLGTGVQIADDVKITRLEDPRSKQRRIDTMLGSSGS